MPKALDINRLHWHKDSNVLTADMSEVRDFGFGMLIGSYDEFEIQGRHETRRYVSAGCVREPAVNEIGDVQYWTFRPVSGQGPNLHIFND